MFGGQENAKKHRADAKTTYDIKSGFDVQTNRAISSMDEFLCLEVLVTGTSMIQELKSRAPFTVFVSGQRHLRTSERSDSLSLSQ